MGFLSFLKSLFGGETEEEKASRRKERMDDFKLIQQKRLADLKSQERIDAQRRIEEERLREAKLRELIKPTEIIKPTKIPTKKFTLKQRPKPK